MYSSLSPPCQSSTKTHDVLFRARLSWFDMDGFILSIVTSAFKHLRAGTSQSLERSFPFTYLTPASVALIARKEQLQQFVKPQTWHTCRLRARGPVDSRQPPLRIKVSTWVVLPRTRSIPPAVTLGNLWPTWALLSHTLLPANKYSPDLALTSALASTNTI